MPAWGAAETLADSVASVQAQTLADWELLIVDDASLDDTLALAKRLATEDPRIKVLAHDVNRGAAAARNTALKAARGIFVTCLDADDLWLPHKLEAQLNKLDEESAFFGYSAFYVRRGDKENLVTVPERVTRDELLKGNVIGCLTAIWDRERLPHVRFPPIRQRQDYALWLKLLEELPYAVGVTEPLAVHRRRDGSLSGSLRRRLSGTWSVYREFEGMSRTQATWSVLRHAISRYRRGLRM